MNLLQKILRGIDWWLANPNNAMVAWGSSSAASLTILYLALEHLMLEWVFERWIDSLDAALPWPIFGAIRGILFLGLVAVCAGWALPLILRLGIGRWIAWMFSFYILAAVGEKLVIALLPRPLPALFFPGFVFAVPAILIAGRREPLGRAFTAIGVYWAVTIFFSLPTVAEYHSNPVALIFAQIAFGAVLIYGTTPIVRRTSSDGERSPSDGEEKASLPPGTASGGEGTASGPRDTPSLGGEN